MKWAEVENRMCELEDRQRELIEEYQGIAELIGEDIEEEDLSALRLHVADLAETLQDLNAVRDELEHLCDLVDDAVDDELMRRAGME